MVNEIKNLLSKGRFCLAIDGRCAAGKTTLSERLQKELGCAVIHLDDFFLPKGMVKDGFGNLEKDRLIRQVLSPMSKGEQVRYQKFSCQSQRYTDTVTVPVGMSVIVEGSYSLLPEFRFAYTHSVFMDISADEQEKRIRKRNGDERWAVFQSRWIPDEEAYFAAFQSEEYADLRLSNEIKKD